MKKRLYIIPGFGDQASQKSYRWIKEYAQEQAYEVVLVPIQWKRTTVNQWMEDFVSVLDEGTSSESVVLGFSFGALILMFASARFSFKKIIVCSLSPYFQEDIPQLPREALLPLGKRRVEAFRKRPFPVASKKAAAVFIIGDKDFSLAITRTKKAYKLWKYQKKITVLPSVGHTLNDPMYMKEIKKNLK